MNKKRNPLIVILSIYLLIMLSGCAMLTPSSTRESPPNEPPQQAPQAPHASDSADFHKILSELHGRFQVLETKLISINDKLDSTRQTLDRLAAEQKPNSEAVIDQPSSEAGTPVESIPSPSDPEYGFINDSSTQLFRKSLILFHSQKYPEAILEFSSFVENNPDHPLAGSAQFYVGESYFKQKEYKLAHQEYQRVLTSYDKSTHVADTLGRLVLTEEALKNSNDAAKHRQLLTSLFPQSPAAAELQQSPPIAETMTEAPKEKIENLEKPATETVPVTVTDTGSHLDPIPTAPMTAPIEEQKAAPAAENESDSTQ